MKNEGARSFGLFNYDRFVSFRPIWRSMGYLVVDSRTGVFALFDTLPCPYPVGDQLSRHENRLAVDCPGVGQVARGLRPEIRKGRS